MEKESAGALNFSEKQYIILLSESYRHACYWIYVQRILINYYITILLQFFNKILYSNLIETYKSRLIIFHSPIIRKGAAKLRPMKSTPRYIQRPKAATVAIAAETLPRSPSHGLLRTQSVIMQVTTENRAINMNVLEK